MNMEIGNQHLPVYFPYYEIKKSSRILSVLRTEDFKFTRHPTRTSTRMSERVRDGYRFRICIPEYGLNPEGRPITKRILNLISINPSKNHNQIYKK